MYSSHQFRTRLNAFWQYLITPVVGQDDPGILFKSRVLAPIFLIAASIVTLFALLASLVPDYETGIETQNLLRAVAVFILLWGYRLCRYGQPNRAVILGAVFNSAVMTLQAFSPGGLFGLDLFYFLGIVIIICGLFSTLRITISMFIYQQVLILAIWSFTPEIRPLTIFTQALFNLFITVFTMLGAYYRQQLDDERKTRIQQNEKRYRSLFESISDIIYTVTPEGIVTAINPAITQVTGWLPEDMIGKPFIEFIHQDDLGAAMNNFIKSVKAEPVAPQELRILGQDGKYHWIETVATPQFDGENIVAVTGSARDINARKQADMARQQTERRFSALVEQMPVAVIELDLDGIITGWNPAAEEVFGYSAEEVLGKDDLSLLVPEHSRALVRDVFEKIRRDSSVAYNINDNVTRDGHLITCEWFNISLTGDDDLPVGILCIATDITQRRQTEEQRIQFRLVKERNTVLKQFMDAISHDFRTALSQIETNRYLVERMLPSEIISTVRTRMDNITSSVRHIETQIGNLGRISGLADLHLSPQNINRLVRHTVDSRRSVADLKKINLSVEVTPDLPLVQMDEDKIYDVLLHLLDNALAFTGAGGSVIVRTACHENYVHVTVTDTGIGIAPEHIFLIFDLFYRVDGARSLNTGGVGLGLSISRLVAEAHSGTLTVSSELGQGSTFTLQLPCLQPGVELTAQQLT